MKKGLPKKKGLTLVEVMVSASIFSIGIVGFAALISKSRELDVTDVHRRRVRSIIDSCFEDTAYHYSNYSNIPAVAGDTVLIDERIFDSTHDDLNGVLIIDTISLQQAATIGPLINYKKIVAKVIWSEPEGLDSIIFEKWITQLP